MTKPKRYIRTLMATFTEAALLWICITIIYTGILYGLSLLCQTYTATPAGIHFMASAGRSAAHIMNFFNRSPVFTALELITLSFAVCCGVAGALQFFQLLPRLFTTWGTLLRMVVWGPLLTLATAFMAQALLGFHGWMPISIACAFPVFCLFPACFTFAQRLTPTIGSLLGHLRKPMIVPANAIFLRPLNPANNREDLIEFDSQQGKLTGNTYQLIDDIATNGIYVQKQKHEFFLYRYGEKLVFQLDDFEILLGEEMNAHWTKSNRFGRNFELRDGNDILLEINYHALPPVNSFIASSKPHIDFFEEMSRIINDKKLFRKAFLPPEHFHA